MSEGFITDSYLEDMAKDASSAVIRMMAKELLEHRRAQPPVTPAQSEDARMLEAILGAVDHAGNEWVADSKRINENLAQSGAISGYVSTRTPEWVDRVKAAIKAAMEGDV